MKAESFRVNLKSTFKRCSVSSNEFKNLSGLTHMERTCAICQIKYSVYFLSRIWAEWLFCNRLLVRSQHKKYKTRVL